MTVMEVLKTEVRVLVVAYIHQHPDLQAPELSSAGPIAHRALRKLPVLLRQGMVAYSANRSRPNPRRERPAIIR